MYNIFQANKIKRELKKQRIKNQQQQKWLMKYNQEVQPQLIQSYNKRINHFVRKIQEKPILIKQFNQYQPNKVFRQLSKQGFIGDQNFKFKDKNDWNSIYTELQRSQMQRNSKIMHKIFGDSSLAYRSIISQSQYTPSNHHQYRQRVKNKQINPPMKYTFLAPKIIIRKFNNKKNNLKIKTQQDHNEMRKNITNNNSVKRTNSFHMLLEDDNRSSRSFKTLQSLSQSFASTKSRFATIQNQQKQKEKQQKKHISPKMHFKTLVQTYQMTKDQKVKQSMKQLLVKCGVFKSKDKKKKYDDDSDGLFSLQNGQNIITNQKFQK